LAIHHCIDHSIDSVCRLLSWNNGDRRGRAVGDLKEEDFQVFDHDKAQVISSFDAQKRAPENEADNKSAAGTNAPSLEGAPLLPPAAQRFIVIANKHDDRALQDAVREVLNCDPGLDSKRDIQIAERLANSTATRDLIVGVSTITAQHTQPPVASTVLLECL
jgi:hypothetical protein